MTNRTITINGLTIEPIETEPCTRLTEWGRGLPITCNCSRCQIDNRGMTSDEIRQRMDRINNRR